MSKFSVGQRVKSHATESEGYEEGKITEVQSGGMYRLTVTSKFFHTPEDDGVRLAHEMFLEAND